MKHIEKRKKPAVLTEEQIIKMFKIPYDENSAWFDKLRAADDKNFDKMTRFVKVFPNDDRIDGLIDSFTLKETTDEDFVDKARKVKNLSRGKILEIQRFCGDDGFKIKFKDGDMTVIKAYKYFDCLLNYMPTQNDARRNGKCHFSALTLSTLLTLSGIENEVVSGYVYEYCKKEEYSHSWVEFKSEKGTPLVFDGNRGAIITKDGYYRIKHPRDISKISYKDIICEQTIIHQLEKVAESWATKLYFHNREMALKVYEKHFGKPFVPKDYDYALAHPETIIQLDDINKQNEIQLEK